MTTTEASRDVAGPLLVAVLALGDHVVLVGLFLVGRSLLAFSLIGINLGRGPRV